MKDFLSKVFKKEFINNYWGGVVLLLLVIIVGIINYKPGTILTGWDNLHPEYYPTLNISRSIFAVWQEYQGLGLLGGMGHASDLIRQIILFLASAIIPLENLRYFSTITTLLVGTLGVYFFIKSHVFPYHDEKKETLSFIGGLFYLLNLATIQTYFVAFEAFITHFAFLPWVLWAYINFFRYKSKKTLVILFFVILLSTPASYIPTLFVVFILCIGIFSLSIILTTAKKQETLIAGIKAMLLITAVNAFWLLPFLFFTLTSSSVNVNSKMNQMATQTIFLQNKAFGDFMDVALLKGFWLNNVDPDIEGNFRLMLAPWRDHLNNPLVLTTGTLVFIIIIFGIINVVKFRRPLHIAYLSIFLFAFTMLATNTIPFSWLVAVFREFPLFGQAFRFPFTKFSLLAGFSFSIIFVLGIEYLMELKEQYSKRFTNYMFIILSVGLIITITLPVFFGHMFYEKEQLKLPQEYYQTFNYFRNADRNTRIANLPQQTFWGWQFFTWGYGGSGFLWYGIEQPILDRAFDVWSDELENYYYEVSYAIYSKNSDALKRVFDKYQVNYVLIDKNIFSPVSPKSVFYEETEELFSNIPELKKEKVFGNITIYKFELINDVNDFVYSTPILPSSNGYPWGNLDLAFEKFGDYKISSNPNSYFPFPTLFTNKLYKKNYSIDFEDKNIIIATKLPEINNSTLILPTLEKDNIIPIEIRSEKSQNETTIFARVLLPEIALDGKKIKENKSDNIPLFVIPEIKGQYKININGGEDKLLDLEKEINIRGYFQLNNDNYIGMYQTETGQLLTQIITGSYLLGSTNLSEEKIPLTKISKNQELKIYLPKVIDSSYSYSYKGTDFGYIEDCNIFSEGKKKIEQKENKLTLTTEDDSLCSSIYTPTLPHTEGYLIDLKTENHSGDPIHFWVLNDNQGQAPLALNLDKKEVSPVFFIPPMEKFGLAYSFHADNVSIAEKSQNTIKSMEVMRIPYFYVTNIVVENDNSPKGKAITFTVSHPNTSSYEIVPKNLSPEPTTIVLSQSYDKMWAAYAVPLNGNLVTKTLANIFPFFSGFEIGKQYKVNNWQNGWEIENPQNLKDKRILIVYLPQYLEYVGFIILIITFFLVIKNPGKLQYPLKKFNIFFESKTESLKHKIKENIV